MVVDTSDDNDSVVGLSGDTAADEAAAANKLSIRFVFWGGNQNNYSHSNNVTLGSRFVQQKKSREEREVCWKKKDLI
jgi:hypothetical protein